MKFAKIVGTPFPQSTTGRLLLIVAVSLVVKGELSSKHFNVGSTLLLGWYDVATLCISTLNWTTLDNVETTLSFSTSIFTTLGNVETTLRIWPFEKIYIYIFELQGTCWTQNLQFLPILRGICKLIFAEPQKFLKHRIYWITKIIFKPFHFVKC